MFTKRDHDAATKRNFGTKMASDERANYHHVRGLKLGGTYGRIDRRAWDMARNRDYGLTFGALAVGTKWRNVAAHFARTGAPML